MVLKLKDGSNYICLNDTDLVNLIEDQLGTEVSNEVRRLIENNTEDMNDLYSKIEQLEREKEDLDEEIVQLEETIEELEKQG